MGRRLPRRMWHSVAALVPLPLIALGYVAVVPGNPVAFQFELYLSGKGSDQALTRRADTAPSRSNLGFTKEALGNFIDGSMIRRDEVSIGRDLQTRSIYTSLVQAFYFLKEHRRIDDHSIANDWNNSW